MKGEEEILPTMVIVMFAVIIVTFALLAFISNNNLVKTEILEPTLLNGIALDVTNEVKNCLGDVVEKSQIQESINDCKSQVPQARLIHVTDIETGAKWRAGEVAEYANDHKLIINLKAEGRISLGRLYVQI